VGSHLVLQLSDVHLRADGPDAAARREHLRRCLEATAATRPDVLLLSGDLTDAGEAGCYEELAERVAAVAAGATVVAVPGNHDDRALLRSHFLGQDAGDEPVNATHWRGGLRLVALDSSVPGEGHGLLDERTLAYLRAAIAAPAPEGTLVMLHHPPLPSPVAELSRIGLRNVEDLRDAIAGSDVRLVVGGHYHHVAAGMIGTVPAWASPAVSTQADLSSTERFRPMPGCALSRIELSAEHHAISVVQLSP
jgi:3',5'-cyclic AMP phosphodiesterase CpdA